MKITKNAIEFHVDTVDDLANLSGEDKQVCIVSDEDRGGVFIYNSSKSNDNDGGIVFNGWVRKYEGPVNVKWFGASETETAENNVRYIQAAINTGKNVNFENVIYKVTGSEDIFSVLGLKNITFNGNGCTFLFEDDTSAPLCNLFKISNSSFISFKKMNIKSNFISYPWVSMPEDITAFKIHNANSDLSFEEIYGENLSALFKVTTDDKSLYQTYNISFNMIRAFSVYYGFNFQNTGSNVIGRNIACVNTGRVYFPYGVSKHDMNIRSQHGGPFSDCLIKVYDETTEDIKLKYSSTKRVSGNRVQNVGEALVCVEIQSDVSLTMKNIDIDLDVYADADDPIYRPRSAFAMKKWTSAGEVDTSTLQHYIIGLSISGVLRYCTQFLASPIEITPSAYGNWSESHFYNFNVSNLTIPDIGSNNTAINIDNLNYPSIFPLRIINSYISGTVDMTNVDVSNSQIAGVQYSSYNSKSKITVGQNSLLFPSTAIQSLNPNALDDYREGTFTPYIYGTSTAGEGTYADVHGTYTKVGNRVSFTIYLSWTDHTGTGDMHIGGLPFTSKKKKKIIITEAPLIFQLTYRMIFPS
jgi:hypothetical protein